MSKMSSSAIVNHVRGDMFDTADGPKFMYCACDGLTRCLYHHHYEVVAASPFYKKPEPTVKEKKRASQRNSGGSPALQDGEARKPPVRGDGPQHGNRPAKPVRGPGRSGKGHRQ